MLKGLITSPDGWLLTLSILPPAHINLSAWDCFFFPHEVCFPAAVVVAAAEPLV
jgi:hypothetical protein